ncbi:50S ribosomal protein L18 [Chitinispirillales bacterium ANBcel5]|uniref:50S ribosomal protein L18 n=1 Tax=Cellulosispirillum alkaliphilum TaxID=3039283 RepID=UPI002A5729F9|nr:50S ribosomal protein L18 [Chitinispirillales bacterium ANBcel5]
MDKAKRRLVERGRRAQRVRRKIVGTKQRPRLCVRRSIDHIYAQIINDTDGVTIASAASLGKEFSEKTKDENLSKSDVSKIIGEIIAEKAKEKGVTSVIFDRKGYLYHGRIKALAEGARSKGLLF